MEALKTIEDTQMWTRNANWRQVKQNIQKDEARRNIEMKQTILQ